MLSKIRTELSRKTPAGKNTAGKRKSVTLRVKLPRVTGIAVSFWVATGYVVLSGLAILILAQSLVAALQPKPQDDLIYETLVNIVNPINQTLSNQLAEIRILRTDNADLELKKNLLAKAEAEVAALKAQEAKLLVERTDLYERLSVLREQLNIASMVTQQAQAELSTLQDKLDSVNLRTNSIVNSANVATCNTFYEVWDLWWSSINP